MAHERFSRRRRRHTPAQRARIVARFHHSGLSRAQFARRQGLVLSTLDRWLAELKGARKDRSPVVFKELRLAQPLASSATAWALEIITPEGLTVRLRESFGVRELARLLSRSRC